MKISEIKQIVLDEQIPQTDGFGGISLIITDDKNNVGNGYDDVVICTPFASELGWLVKELLDSLSKNDNPVLYIENISKVIIANLPYIGKAQLQTFLLFLIDIYKHNKFNSLIK